METMRMNVKPVATLDDEINDIRMRTAEIVNNHILPNENKLWAVWRRRDSPNASISTTQMMARGSSPVRSCVCRVVLERPQQNDPDRKNTNIGIKNDEWDVMSIDTFLAMTAAA